MGLGRVRAIGALPSPGSPMLATLFHAFCAGEGKKTYSNVSSIRIISRARGSSDEK